MGEICHTEPLHRPHNRDWCARKIAEAMMAPPQGSPTPQISASGANHLRKSLPPELTTPQISASRAHHLRKSLPRRFLTNKKADRRSGPPLFLTLAGTASPLGLFPRGNCLLAGTISSGKLPPRKTASSRELFLECIFQAGCFVEDSFLCC